ncbi:hypothetical protein ACFOX2_07045 [Corynebacterium marambiense]|uniref:hypothetical protein n=1 Tax=Corynebacterium marambiense TaxID=2765364 RepID=UPI00362340E2
MTPQGPARDQPGTDSGTTVRPSWGKQRPDRKNVPTARRAIGTYRASASGHIYDVAQHRRRKSGEPRRALDRGHPRE